jgi:hypothetical protein
MAYASAMQGGLGTGGSVILHESPAHSVLVPDTELLFTAQFHRAGPDLVLTGRDGQHHLVPGYFASEQHPALVAPNGAHLSPETVDLLAGSPTPGQYAQAQPAPPPDTIGKVEKVVGDVTVVRNGVAVALHVGDAVFKSDVVQTGVSSACGISFPDGTALNLVANTRMALNDYAYDSNSGGANGALFTLVEGTFAFVAGKVAHSGDMKIATPVATMGIRGTTGVVQEVATISAQSAGQTYTFAVVPDFGTGVSGVFDLIATDANGNPILDANGNPVVLSTVSQTGYVTYLTPQGIGQPPLVTTEPVTNSQYAFEQDILQQLFQTLNPSGLNRPGNNGSSTTPPPFELPNPIPQLFEDSGKPFTINAPGSGSTITVTILDTVGSSGLPTVVIWTGGVGPWLGPTWTPSGPPQSFQEVIVHSGKPTLSSTAAANGLEVDAGAIVNIANGGVLEIFKFIQGGGTIQLNASGADPTLEIDGLVKLSGGGIVEMIGTPGDDNIIGIPGSSALLLNIDYLIEGTGTIGGGDGNLTFENFGTVNANDGLLTINTGNQYFNGGGGLTEATAGGTLAIKDSVANAGTVKADGAGSTVALSGKTFDNFFSVVAKNGGSITFTGVAVTNEAISASDPTGGTINAAGGTIAFNGGSLANGNMLEATVGGTLQLENIVVTNSSAGSATIDATSNLDLIGAAILGGTIENDGNAVVTGGASVLHGDSVTNAGTMTVLAGASLTLEGDTTLVNEAGGLITADGAGATVSIELDTDTNVNSGTIKAVNGGEVDVHVNVDGGSNHGLIEAGAGGTVHFFGHHDGGGGGGGGDGGQDGGGDKGGNFGTMEATDGGVLIFDGGLDNFDLVEAVNGGQVYLNNGIKNHAGTVESSGAGSQIFISGGGDSVNADTIIAENDGVIALASVVLTNDADAMIEATSGGSISWITGGIDNFGIFDADGGSITFGGSIGITNEAGGIFEASDGGSITFGTSGIGSVSNAAGGLIEALGGGTITFDSTLNGGQNAGTIMADGGTIVIDGFEGGNGLFNGDGMGGIGVIQAIHGGKVELAGATIIGGKLGTMSGGVFETTAGTSTLINVILTGGVFKIDAGTILDLNGGSNGVAAYIDSTVTLQGPGTVEMDFTSYSIRGGLANGTLNNQTTIKGQGTIGTGDTPLPGVLTLINSGTIEAVGGEFDINTGTRNSATTTNSGTLEANGVNAVLLIHHTNMNNGGGTIAAINGVNAISATASVVELLDVNIVGGTLATTNFGTIETIDDISGNPPSISSFDNVINNAYVLVSDHTTLILRDTLSGTGTIALADGPHGELLKIDGAVTLDGGGQITLAGIGQIAAFPNSTLDNVGDTISGAGTIGDGSGDHNLTLKNEPGGTIDANVDDATLTVYTGNIVTNAGTMEATNGGTLQIDDVVSNSGTILADGGTINITKAIESTNLIKATGGGAIVVTVVGLDLENTATGTVDADTGGTITLNITGDNIYRGTYEALNGGVLDINITNFDATGGNLGTIKADDGSVSIHGGISNSTNGLIEALNDGTISIVGEITNDGGTIEAASGGSITLGEDAATLAHSLDPLVNDGSTIEAIAGGTITFESSLTGVTNKDAAVIEAGAGGTIIIDAVKVANDGGTIEALGSNAVVDLNGTTIDGGTLETDSSGVIDALTGTSTFDGVTIAGGFIKAETDATVDLEDKTTLSGTVTFEGGGTFVLDPGPASIVGGDGGGTLDIAAGATLAGAGTIGNGTTTSLTLNNCGTIDATGCITIDLVPNTLTNDGLMEATGGGELKLLSTVGNSNIIAAYAGSTVYLDDTIFNTDCGQVIASGHCAVVDLFEATIRGGTVKSDCGGLIQTVAGLDDAPTTSTFDGVTIGCGSDVKVVDYTTLVLENETTMSGGRLSIESSGVVEIANGDGGIGATLTNVTVHDCGEVTVDSDTTLALSGVKVYGGAITGTDAASGDIVASTIDVTGDSTFCNVDLSGGDVTVEKGAALTLDGGTVSDVTLQTNGDGLIEIGCGGSTFDNLTIASDAKVEVDSGATLTLQDTINSSGTITVDSGATLYLNDAALDGGTIKDNGTVEMTVDSTIGGGAVIDGDVGSLVIDCDTTLTADGATLQNLDVTNHGAAIDIDSGTTLTLSDVTVHGGTIDGVDATSGDLASTIDVTGDSTFCGVHLSGGDLTVESDVTLALSGDRLSDVAINGTDAASGGVIASTIDVTGDSTFCGVHLSGGDLTVESDVTLTLSGDRLSDVAINGTDAASGGVIASTIDVTGDSTFSDVSLSGGDVTVESGVTLKLSGDTVSDVAINGTDAASGDVVASTIDITGDTTFNEVTMNGGDLTVEGRVTLILSGDTLSDVAIENGAVGDGGVSAGTIHVTGNSHFDDVTLNDGKLIVGSGAELTLSGSTISGANVQVYDHNALNQIVTGTIDVLDTSAIDNSAVNGGGGTLRLEDGVTLTVDNTELENLNVTNGGTLQVDGNDMLTLAAVHIDSGTIDDYTDTTDGVVGATIDVVGGSAITNATIDGQGGPGGGDGDGKPGALIVESDVTLTLDGSTLEDLNVTNHGTLLVEATDTLTLDNVSIDNGTIEGTNASGAIVASNIDITGDTTFGDLTVENGNLTINESTALKVADDTTVTLDGVNVADNGDLDVGVSSGATLALDDNASISGSGAMTINGGSTLDVDGGTTTINLVGTITNDGTLEASNGGTLDIKSTVDNTYGALLAASGGLLDIETAISGGNATIQGGKLEFDAASNVNVTFDNGGPDGTNYGELILGDPKDFSGQISDFTGSAIGISNSDEIFLSSVQENDEHPLDADYNSDSNITTVTIYEEHGGQIKLYFVGNYEAGNFKLVQDANGLEIYDPPVGGAKHAPAPVTTAGDNHTSAPANQVAHATDHAASLTNLFGFGGGQDSTTPAAAWHDNEVAAPADQLALGGKAVIAPSAAAPGGVPAGSSFVDGGADGSAGEAGAGAANGSSTQSLLSALLKTLTGGEQGGANLQLSDNASPLAAGTPGTSPVLDHSKHLTDSTILDGAGSANSQAAHAPLPAAPANEHAAAPSLFTSPTIASAFGTLNNDNFSFHANLGSDPAQNTGAHANELAHGNMQIGGPALGSTAPEFHAEFAVDVVHQDVTGIPANLDQFHQMAANATLLH